MLINIDNKQDIHEYRGQNLAEFMFNHGVSNGLIDPTRFDHSYMYPTLDNNPHIKDTAVSKLVPFGKEYGLLNKDWTKNHTNFYSTRLNRTVEECTKHFKDTAYTNKLLVYVWSNKVGPMDWVTDPKIHQLFIRTALDYIQTNWKVFKIS